MGHPINPASGAVYDTLVDSSSTAAAEPFKRFYNSTDASGADLSAGWQHSFTRHLVAQYSSSTYKPYVASPDNSSLYNDEVVACTSGFATIKGRVSAWATATASYVSGACAISVGSTTVATLPILYTAPPTPAPGTSVINGYDVTRDDGQSIRFTVINGVITAPPGTGLKLVQTSGGFTLTDSGDKVEQYDNSGKLLSVSSRAGVVETMSYDASGRLSSVIDSFGHQLVLSYDASGHLTSVTKQ